MKRAYRIMAFTLSLAVVLGNVNLTVFATDTEATYSVNEQEEVKEPAKEKQDVSEARQETNEIKEETTETVLTDEDQVTEAETLIDDKKETQEKQEKQEKQETEKPDQSKETEVTQESKETKEHAENEKSDEINEEKTETVLTDEIQDTEAETLGDDIEKEADNENDIQPEEETETILTDEDQDIEAETLEVENLKFNVTFVDFDGKEVVTLEVSDVDEIKLPEAPEKEGYSFIKWDINLKTLELTEDLTIRPIYEEVETENEITLISKKLSKTVDGKVISIEGIMPENAEIVVEKVKYTQNIKTDIEELLDKKATVVVYEAFDIKIKVGDEVYQPTEFDEAVVVSIKNIKVNEKEGEALKVFHIDDDNNIEEVESTVDVDNKVAEFVADSFSIYVIGGVTYDTDNATLLDNAYGTAYLYDDGTLLVTAFKKAGSTLYPWYSKRADITNVRFDDSITEIPDYTFEGYIELTGDLILPNNLKNIGYGAFWGCTNLNGKLVLPNGLQTIREYAFAGCSLTGNLVLPDTLQTIREYAFAGCKDLEGDLVIPASVTKIDYGGFWDCSSLGPTLTFQGDVELGGFAFLNNYGIKTIVFEEPLSQEISADNRVFECSDVIVETTVIGGKEEEWNNSYCSGSTIRNAWYVANRKPLEIIFNPENGEEATIVDVYRLQYSSFKIDVPAEPIRDGYKFKGWYFYFYNIDTSINNIHYDVYKVDYNFEKYFYRNLKQELSIGSDFVDTVYSNTDLQNGMRFNIYAEWEEIKKHSISFETNGADPIDPVEVRENDKLTPPTEPVKEGHTFKGWFTDQNLTSGYDFNTPVTSEFTLYAKWDVNKYTISFDSDGGENYPEQVIEYNNLITNPGEPNKEGYIFLGWYKGNTKWIFTSDKVKEDIELLAKYEIKKYDIVYQVDGTQFHSEIVEHGKEAVGTPAEPTKTGYTFKGWFNGNEEFDFNNPIKENITLKAKWEVEKVNKPTENPTPPTDENPPAENPNPPTEENPPADNPNPPTEENPPADNPNPPAEENPPAENPTPPAEENPPADNPNPPAEENPPAENPNPPTEENPPAVETTPVDDIENSDINEETGDIISTEKIVPDEEDVVVVEEPLYNIKIREKDMRNTMSKFVEAVKFMGIVFSVSLLALLGILGLLLLIIAWMKRVKVLNDHNLDDYADENFVVVYKTSVKSEGNRLAELFKKEDRVWTLSIPENVISEKVTDTFKIELKKGFCKKYNGEQIIVVLENENEDLVKNLGFVIDKQENEIRFSCI